MYQVIIIGGGLAGLINAILLARAGISTLVIEKKVYPFHKVCGEYVSNEVKQFLVAEGLYPSHVSPPQIKKLLISSRNGKLAELPLEMGGFGISRFELDHFWYQEAKASGVQFQLGASVRSVTNNTDSFEVHTTNGDIFQASLVIGAYGKRSQLDKKLQRPFIRRRSPYVAVKYHVRHPWDPQRIALHGFDQGYCGVSMVEDNKLNLCYLTSRFNLRKQGDLESLEQTVLSRNPHLKAILSSAERLNQKPMVINEIAFGPRRLVANEIIMAGDAAGLITPLCGNGMAMAIHAGKLLAPKVIRYCQQPSYSRDQLLNDYQTEWNAHFSRRLSVGKHLQKLFHTNLGTAFLLQCSRFPMLAQWIVRQTHGPVI